MDVATKAKELGEAIQACEEYKRLQDADAEYQADAEAQRLINEYNKIRLEMAKRAQDENLTPQELEDIRRTLNREFAKLENNPKIKAYIDAKKDFESVMGTVNGIIRYYVTGEEPGCGGSCSTCSGCR